MRTVLLSFLVLSFGMPLGQAQTTQNRVSLPIGSTQVWLGMSKAEFMKEFAGSGHQVSDAGNTVAVQYGHESNMLQFKDGRLVYADREWDTDESDQLGAVLGALRSLAEKSGYQPCQVLYEPISEPSNSAERVFVVCGQRSVLILKGKLNNQAIMDVSERIGNVPN